MLSQVNSIRTTRGERPLTLCAALVRTAANQSVDQARGGAPSHTGANGSTLTQRVNAAGVAGTLAVGENVASGFTAIDAVITGWMNSGPHRANLLNAAFTNVGFGKATATTGVVYWTQDFTAGGTC